MCQNVYIDLLWVLTMSQIIYSGSSPVLYMYKIKKTLNHTTFSNVQYGRPFLINIFYIKRYLYVKY